MSESDGSCTSAPEGQASRLTVADLELSDLLQQAVIQNQLSAPSVAPAYLVQLGSPTRHSIRLPHCTIGRNASNHIVVSGDPSVSRHHCLLLAKGDSYYIVDLGSKNGTIVNDEPVAAQCRLMHGDKLRIGVTRLEFCLARSPLLRSSLCLS